MEGRRIQLQVEMLSTQRPARKGERGLTLDPAWLWWDVGGCWEWRYWITALRVTHSVWADLPWPQHIWSANGRLQNKRQRRGRWAVDVSSHLKAQVLRHKEPRPSGTWSSRGPLTAAVRWTNSPLFLSCWSCDGSPFTLHSCWRIRGQYICQYRNHPRLSRTRQYTVYLWGHMLHVASSCDGVHPIMMQWGGGESCAYNNFRES